MPTPAPWSARATAHRPRLAGGVTNKIGRAMRTTRAGKVIVTCVRSMGKSWRIIARGHRLLPKDRCQDTIIIAFARTAFRAV